MALKILLIISIILQLFAAASAIGLTRYARYNMAWILFTLALTLMALVRYDDYIAAFGGRQLALSEEFLIWAGVATSLFFAVGVILVRRFIKGVRKLDIQRRLTEKRILNTVILTEEKERSRFSKDLHDGLGPLLSSAKLSLSALQRCKDEGQRAEILANSHHVISEAIRSLREISNNLSPHVLKDFGLDRAIKAFIEKSFLSDSFSVDYISRIEGKRFDNNIEVILYRVVCELFNNSYKHSDGDKIKLEISIDDDILSLNYSDNGHGFNPVSMAEVGMGLSNINSRINSVKGKVEIVSAPNEGMSAKIKVNLIKKDLWRKNAK